jgi:hypothetical protein
MRCQAVDQRWRDDASKERHQRRNEGLPTMHCVSLLFNYDFQQTFGEKLLKYIAILVPFILFFRRYFFIFVLSKTLIKLFLTCLAQELLFSYVNYVL